MLLGEAEDTVEAAIDDALGLMGEDSIEDEYGAFDEREIEA